MVKGVEDLRTPLNEIIKLDKDIRGTLSGFMMPSFVIDLPGGGGKRLVSTHESYHQGIATYTAPGLQGTKGSRTYTYYDPKPVEVMQLAELHQQKVQALHNGQTLEELAQSEVIKPPLVRAPTAVPLPAVSQDFGGRYQWVEGAIPSTPSMRPLPSYPNVHIPYPEVRPSASMHASAGGG
jgi:lysine 2,3-aminomutase